MFIISVLPWLPRVTHMSLMFLSQVLFVHLTVPKADCAICVASLPVFAGRRRRLFADGTMPVWFSDAA